MNLEELKRKYMAEGARLGYKKAMMERKMLNESTGQKLSGLQYGRLLQKKAEEAGLMGPEEGNMVRETAFIRAVAKIAKDTPWNGNNMLDMGGYTSQPGMDIGDFENAIFDACARMMYGKIPASGSAKEYHLFKLIRSEVSKLKQG